MAESQKGTVAGVPQRTSDNGSLWPVHKLLMTRRRDGCAASKLHGYASRWGKGAAGAGAARVAGAKSVEVTYVQRRGHSGPQM